MKKFILSVFLPLLLFLSASFPVFQPPLSATADASPTTGSYACVLNENTYFYSTRDEKRGLFLLPTTYFVKVLSVEPDFCKIEYLYDDTNVKKLTGYAKTSELTFVDYVPTRPYLYHLFNVRYTIEGGFSNDDTFLNEITVTCAYYGDYKIGSETYCYVLRGDSFGYIPKPADLYIEPNAEYADRLSSEQPTVDPQPPTQDQEGMPPAQIAILIVLCLLVPVLAALILKPPKRPPYETDE